ncbi:hypothetical protein [Evansella tamaricis]|uniref:Uncharacterized protein n=1 Tax=Evansella tamaricis TaxID=2069301 RepID=A0ABS6JK83_9BACI|nr:hypothetical protein [Evansella tamaricis]MBU9713227.1 hypothetical protein [Evansella tamaricis]
MNAGCVKVSGVSSSLPVVLTGDYKLAIVLNQLLFWSQYVKDFDQFIEGESKRGK